MDKEGQRKFDKTFAEGVRVYEERIKELEEALKPFVHEDLSRLFSGNNLGDDSIVFQRNKAVLKIGDFKKAKKALCQE